MDAVNLFNLVNLVLATEEMGHFGLNLDIFETNLINLAIVIGVLVYFGRGFLGKTLGDRQTAIATEIKDAEERKQQAAICLADEQQKLAQAQQEAQRIRQDAEVRARQAKDELLAQAKREIERLKQTASQDTTASQERAIAEIRDRIASLALAKAEEDLNAQLSTNNDMQRQLVDRSIALLGGK